MNTLLLFGLGLLAVIMLIRHPEISLVCFLLAGTFKTQFEELFPHFPDLTIVTAGLLVAGLCLQPGATLRAIKRLPFNFIMVFLAIVALMTLSACGAVDNHYAWEKTLRFALLTGLGLFAAPVAVESEARLMRFFGGTLVISLLMIFMGRSTPEGLTAFGATHIATGRTIGLGLLAALFFALRPAHLGKLGNGSSGMAIRVMCALVAGVLVYGVLFSGSRGVFVALSLTLAFAGICALGFRRGRNYALAGALLVGLTVFGTTTLAPDAASTMSQRLSGPVEEKAYTRVIRATAALEMFRARPFTGVGIGGFDIEFSPYESERGDYPHNLFLEVGAELGIVGLVLFGLLFTIPLRRALARVLQGKQPVAFFVLVITVYFLVNALFSGDLNDNRFLFAALGLCLTPLTGRAARGAGGAEVHNGK